MAIKMLEQSIDIDTVSLITGFAKEEVEALAR